MESKKVSVIIPTLNRINLLKRALTSVINQTHKNLEILVIDDSPDKEINKKNKDMIEDLTDNRIKFILNENKHGGAGARNHGLKLATGELIAFLDDDDIWKEEKIRLQVEKLLANPNVGIIYCDYELFDNDENKITDIKNRTKGKVYLKLLKSFCISETSTALIKKEVLNKIGLFDENLRANHEYDLYIRISEFYEFDYVDKILVKKYHYNERISADFTRKVKGLKLFYKKHKYRYYKLPLSFRLKNTLKYYILLIIFSLGRLIGDRVYSIIPKRFK
jgi:glycosyltransferase involved in cell wall biosynthesis